MKIAAKDLRPHDLIRSLSMIVSAVEPISVGQVTVDGLVRLKDDRTGHATLLLPQHAQVDVRRPFMPGDRVRVLADVAGDYVYGMVAKVDRGAKMVEVTDFDGETSQWVPFADVSFEVTA